MNEDAYFDNPDALLAADSFIAYSRRNPSPQTPWARLYGHI